MFSDVDLPTASGGPPKLEQSLDSAKLGTVSQREILGDSNWDPFSDYCGSHPGIFHRDPSRTNER